MVYSSPQNGSKSLHTVAVLKEKNIFKKNLGALYLQSVLPFLPILTDQSEIAQKLMMSTCRHHYTSCCLETSQLTLADSIKLRRGLRIWKI